MDTARPPEPRPRDPTFRGAKPVALAALLVTALLPTGWLRPGGAAGVAPIPGLESASLPTDRSPPGERSDPPATGATSDGTVRDEAGRADETDDLDAVIATEPAILRAAEKSLQRLRTQFAQSLQPSIPDPERRGSLSSPGAVPPVARTSPAAAAGAEPAPPATVRGSHGRDARAAPDGAPERPAAESPRPPRELTLPPRAPQPARDRLMRLSPPEGSVTLIGEATALIRSHGLTVLTDPNFLHRGEPARLGLGRTVVRAVDPAVDLASLPPIDLIVLSRLREDRLDRIARRRLPRDVPIVAPPEARNALLALGFVSVHGLPEWGSLRIVGEGAWLQLTATPTDRGPALLAALQPASMGTLLEFGDDGQPASRRMWISGDTRMNDDLLALLQRRLGELDLAMLHIGGPTLPGGWGGSMDARDGRRLAARLAPRESIALPLVDFAPDRRTRPAAARTGPMPASIAAEPEEPGTRLLTPTRGTIHRLAPNRHWTLAGEAPARAPR